MIRAIYYYLRRLWYRNVYLQSQHWHETRLRALARAHYACQDCGKSNVPLDTHHVTYERLGAEKPGDLRVLCRECHNKRH